MEHLEHRSIFGRRNPSFSGFWGMKWMKSHDFGPRNHSVEFYLMTWWSTNPTIPLISLDAAEVLRKHGGIYEESVGRVSSWVGCQSVDISSSTLVDRRWSTLKISEPKEDFSTNKSFFFVGASTPPTHPYCKILVPPLGALTPTPFDQPKPGGLMVGRGKKIDVEIFLLGTVIVGLPPIPKKKINCLSFFVLPSCHLT